MKRYLLVIFALLSSTVSFVAFGGKVTITSDAVNGKVGVGESFHITIEAVNCNGNIDMSQVPPGLKVVYHTTRSSMSTSIHNGQTEQSKTTSLIMTCKGETIGNYKFGPVSVDGVKSNVISYQVVAASQSGGGQSDNSSQNSSSSSGSFPSQKFDPNGGPVFIGKGNEEMFLRASVNKTTAYEQEAIVYTVKLYTTYGDIRFLGAAAAPKFDGFVIEESDDISSSFVFEPYNGKEYMTAVIARYIIFPQKSGKLTVQGNTYTVSTDARQYYHDPYFQTMTVKYPIQLNVTPNDVVIDVKELPTPIPDNFIGGVGSFTISSSMPSTNLATNQAASLIYTIQGTGNVKYLKMPELAPFFPKSLEIYSPEVKVDSKVGSSSVSGSARFDYSIMPHETGDFTLPEIELTYFDPSDGQYKKLKTQAFHIKVAMGQSSDKSQQTVSFNPELMPVGNPSRKFDAPYVNSFLYWLWYIIPVLIFIVSLGAYRKYIKDHEDLVLLRSKQANKMALKRLANAYKCIQKNQEEQFYDEMLKALWGYIGDKLRMPVSELNRGNVSEEFKKHGVKEATFMPIINLIDECEYAKYTPVSRSANMHQLYADAVDSLSKVESEYSEEQHHDDDDETETGSDSGQSARYINTSAPADAPASGNVSLNSGGESSPETPSDSSSNTEAK